MILGLRVEGAGVWEVSQGFGVAVYAVLLVALVAALLRIAYRVPGSTTFGPCRSGVPVALRRLPLRLVLERRALRHLAHARRRSRARGGPMTAVSGNVARWSAIVILVAATARHLVAFKRRFGALTSFGKLTTWDNPESLVISLGNALHGAPGGQRSMRSYWVAYDCSFLDARDLGHVRRSRPQSG